MVCFSLLLPYDEFLMLAFLPIEDQREANIIQNSMRKFKIFDLLLDIMEEKKVIIYEYQNLANIGDNEFKITRQMIINKGIPSSFFDKTIAQNDNTLYWEHSLLQKLQLVFIYY